MPVTTVNPLKRPQMDVEKDQDQLFAFSRDPRRVVADRLRRWQICDLTPHQRPQKGLNRIAAWPPVPSSALHWDFGDRQGRV